MPRCTSTNSSDKDDRSEEGIPTLLILTRGQHRRFIDEQRTISSKLIRTFSPDRVVFYTTFNDPTIVHDNALEVIQGVQEVIYEIIFDQRSRTIFDFYTRNLQEGTFERCRGEREDILEAPP
jgi:hypothetical protein